MHKARIGFRIDEFGPRRLIKKEINEWGTAIPAPAIAAAVAQLVEHVLGKDEVIGSSPISSSCAAWFVASAGLDNIYFRLAGGKNSRLTARKRLQIAEE